MGVRYKHLCDFSHFQSVIIRHNSVKCVKIFQNSNLSEPCLTWFHNCCIGIYTYSSNLISNIIDNYIVTNKIKIYLNNKNQLYSGTCFNNIIT